MGYPTAQPKFFFPQNSRSAFYNIAAANGLCALLESSPTSQLSGVYISEESIINPFPVSRPDIFPSSSGRNNPSFLPAFDSHDENV